MGKYETLNAIRIFLDCIIVVLPIVLIGIIVKYQNQLYTESNDENFKIFKNYDTMTFILDNIKQKPINYIEFDYICNKDTETAILGYFEGTTYGCKCPDSGLQRGQCSQLYHSNNCLTIPSINPQPFLNWKNKKFCFKRNQVFEQILENGNCQGNRKKCDNKYCVQKDEECPITNIKILSDTTSDSLIIERNLNQLPILNLSVAFGQNPCLDKNSQPKRQNSTYPLYQNNEVGCGTNTLEDKSTIQVENITEQKLLEDNYLYELLHINLPNYQQQPQKENISLFTRGKFIRNNIEQCLNLKMDQFDKLIQYDKDIRSKYKTLYNILFYTSIVIIIFQLIASVKYIDSVRIKDEKPVFLKIHKDLSAFIALLIPLCLLLIQFILINNENGEKSTRKQILDFFKGIQINQCFNNNSDIQEYLELASGDQFFDGLNTLYKQSECSLIFFLILFGTQILCTALKYLFKWLANKYHPVLTNQGKNKQQGSLNPSPRAGDKFSDDQLSVNQFQLSAKKFKFEHSIQ